MQDNITRFSRPLGFLVGLTFGSVIFVLLAPMVSSRLSYRSFKRYDGAVQVLDPPHSGGIPDMYTKTGLGVLMFVLIVPFNAVFYIVMYTGGEIQGCAGPLGSCARSASADRARTPPCGSNPAARASRTASRSASRSCSRE